MKKFLDKDFLLQTETAQNLFHKYAENEPIFDFHNHLSAREIYENKPLGNLANAWLDHDHYKWRAMRAAGVDEKYITGHLTMDAEFLQNHENYDYERYLSFVKTIQYSVGNPLYHWTHLELQRYFNINEPLTEKNAKSVWEKCNEYLQKKEYTPRGLLEMQKVKILCTTDDPIDDLQWHIKLAELRQSKKSDSWDVKVLPSFRPDLAISCENKAFGNYLTQLQKVSGVQIKSVDDLLNALSIRMDYFKNVGSIVSDHSLENDFYTPTSFEDANFAFEKAWMGKELTKEEICQYKTYMLIALGKLYAEKGFVMQIHIGALRDQNGAMLASAGKNIGEDSLHDFNYVSQLGAILNGIYSCCKSSSEMRIANCAFPKVILYNLNPKDNEALATMAANFRNCIFGPAWWFNDHKDGIEEQIRVFARTSVLGKYVGMLTDSRSFLSYPRHEYFRRILCNYIGNLVENGEFPYDEKLLGEMVKNISYKNSVKFFE